MSSDIYRCSVTQVYVGFNKKDSREIAVKRMSKRAITNAQHEVKALRKLNNHRNIVGYQVKYICLAALYVLYIYIYIYLYIYVVMRKCDHTHIYIRMLNFCMGKKLFLQITMHMG